MNRYRAPEVLKRFVMFPQIFFANASVRKQAGFQKTVFLHIRYLRKRLFQYPERFLHVSQSRVTQYNTLYC